ncbi:unnamed protein product [Oncorhynchus mykiss]|uniref:Uncharacterized protein n=1 Tax=Oncorhynchus mykiss TaxID=8022 RepID=A0A060WTW4_ONCMY|nr:unnamed protein product [Oncorhynchus mykiss]
MCLGSHGLTLLTPYNYIYTIIYIDIINILILILYLNPLSLTSPTTSQPRPHLSTPHPPVPSLHAGGRSCSDSDMPIKQCPMCGVYIERNQGCAQMLCKSCKHTFCWYCLQNLDGDIFLRHYDKGPCRNKLGHSRASVMWNRTQVVGILVGVSVIVLVASPLLLLASPCVLCCLCKPCRGKKKRRKKKELTQTDIQPELSPTKSQRKTAPSSHHGLGMDPLSIQELILINE